MSIFHSTVSRRQFMKVLGLAGAGTGAAALVAPNFHDIDEVVASGDSMQKHPWYVKERERLDPAVEIDWDLMARYDRRQMGQCAYIRAKYYGKAIRRKSVSPIQPRLQKQRMLKRRPRLRPQVGSPENRSQPVQQMVGIVPRT